MPKESLTKDKIINEAFAIITENGYDNFSLRILADRLQIKAPSLYKHIKNIDEITFGVTVKIIDHYNEYKTQIIGTKKRTEALIAYANAVRSYAHAYPDYFKMLMLFPALRGGASSVHSPLIVEALIKILLQYDIPEERIYHLQRIFRSTLMGFIACENAGFFHDDNIDKEESFSLAISSFITALEFEEQNNK